MTFNKELLLKVKDFILKNPDKFGMGQWMNECKTSGCIAGWTCLIQEGIAETDEKVPLIRITRQQDDFPLDAAKYLGLEWEEESHYISEITAKNLFYHDEWIDGDLSDEFIEAISLYHDKKLAAEIVGKYIDVFIEAVEKQEKERE